MRSRGMLYNVPMDWTTVIATLAGGGIGLAGTGLQHRFTRKDAVSDRSKGEMQTVLELFAHLSQMITRQSHGVGEENPYVEAAVTLEEINVHAALIGDAEVRRRINDLTWLLNDPGGAASPGESAAMVRRRLLEYGRDVLGAGIRGDQLPAEPPWLKTYLVTYDRYTDDLANQYEAFLAAQAEGEKRKPAEESPDNEGQ